MTGGIILFRRSSDCCVILNLISSLISIFGIRLNGDLGLFLKGLILEVRKGSKWLILTRSHFLLISLVYKLILGWFATFLSTSRRPKARFSFPRLLSASKNHGTRHTNVKSSLPGNPSVSFSAVAFIFAALSNVTCSSNGPHPFYLSSTLVLSNSRANQNKPSPE